MGTKKFCNITWGCVSMNRILKWIKWIRSGNRIDQKTLNGCIFRTFTGDHDGEITFNYLIEEYIMDVSYQPGIPDLSVFGDGRKSVINDLQNRMDEYQNQNNLEVGNG